MNTVDIAATKTRYLPDNATPQDICEMHGGSLWLHRDGGAYILSVVGYNDFCMISLRDGNRFSKPRYHNDFRRVDSSVTIHPKY